ncbi:hypothetical protein ACFIQF_13150 [Comamonas sp. J-3]|uniref:hypothetical protein n=1 Tax=Comamonas trifloxystrobinivorans TaxID=3350256 RepID=UPI00372AB32B
MGKWLRFPTADKPKHKNGAVKFMGDHGFVQNHATMQEVALWRAEGVSKIAQQQIQRVANVAAIEVRERQAKAAREAAQLLSECELTRGHEYMVRKGFAEEYVNTIEIDGQSVVVIPMRAKGQIVGVQKIWADGTKKFIFGQQCSFAEFVFGKTGIHVLCEGYATGLSAFQAFSRLKRPVVVHVCFSAGNMKKVASGLPGGLVVADNDASKTGENVAKEIGWPFWMSDAVGEDANDYLMRKGLFALTEGLKKVIREGGLR